ncbi:MAG: hypothetical protein FWB71_05800 [Defluviitaleaceae bacterium]|nr:hypothetical protein [Defluviitaleaceae bacterium]
MKQRIEKYKTEWKNERAKMKNMPLREKAVYIRQYYFWPILLGAVAIYFAIYLIFANFINPSPPLGLGVAFYGAQVHEDILRQFEDDVAYLLDFDPEQIVINVQNYSFLDFDPEFGIMRMNLFDTLVAAAQKDVVIVHPDAFHFLHTNEYAMDLRLFLDEDQLDQFAHLILYGYITHWNRQTAQFDREPFYTPFGISLRESEYFAALHPALSDWLIIIPANTPRLATAQTIVNTKVLGQ